jgi:hypothetical protein
LHMPYHCWLSFVQRIGSLDGIHCSSPKPQAGLLGYRKNSCKFCNRKGLNWFCDADWGTSDTRRSMTGNIFHYNGAPIHWPSGGRSYRKRSRFRRQKRNTMQHQWRLSRSSTFVHFSRTWDSCRRDTSLSTRTTTHALNGVTKSSVVESAIMCYGHHVLWHGDLRYHVL